MSEELTMAKRKLESPKPYTAAELRAIMAGAGFFALLERLRGAFPEARKSNRKAKNNFS